MGGPGGAVNAPRPDGLPISEVARMGERICTINGCGRGPEARGYCTKHYQKWQRYGDPLAGMEYQPGRTCQVEACGRAVAAKGLCQSHYDTWRHFGRLHLLPTDVAARLWSKVQAGAPDQCWPFDGAKLPGGYGKLAWNGEIIGAHRVAYALTHGVVPPVTMHTCDNPPCCNPAHLVAGTPALNSADMSAKGRAARGERHPNAKLTADDVREIRRLAALGERHRLIADVFCISKASVGMIARRVNWRHIT